MKRIPRKEVAKLRELDLLTYLTNYYPDELIKNGNNDYKTRTHSSLHLSNGMWYYWANGIGGKSALDYLIYVEEYTFKDAVKHLQDLIKQKSPSPIKQKVRQQIRFQLPPQNENNDFLIHYLNKKRFIDKEIIEYCVDNHLIYEAYYDHSVVFVGYDEFNIPRFATKRSTDSSWKKDILGSNKDYSFSISNWTSDSLHVFESAIDLLSYLTILKNQNKKYLNENYLSLSGVSGDSSPALASYLAKHGNIKFIYLHLDNDEAGITAAEAIRNKYINLYYIFDQHPESKKDINEELEELIHEKVLR